ncbi:putative branched-chain-amino-acid aminotransferase [Thalassoglobus neptunius]|uniref:branched-chain-amino-acid transaminase n=1 Tax=Thalassoglobus neptunius TaxID=1938619 RepID=A0A5C5WZU2_9PLAN|nr:aminotransferase class IV [Thalassoglobus neptunius]TWT55819.1 putative branched-chain-amino-acid aminotransferase [Thalassoglobus neptunius]
MQGQTPICYLDGEVIPFEDAKLPIYDLGVMQGATITERLRTVRHVPYLVSEHLLRMQESLRLAEFPISETLSSLSDVIHHIAETNTGFIPKESDLTIVVFVTAGQAMGDANGIIAETHPTVCVYSAPLPLQKWSRWHRDGVHLVIPERRQIPVECLDPRIKMRSRLHWMLADQAARKVDPHAMALLLNLDGHLTETSSGNLFIVRDNQLKSPPREKTLNGISQHVVVELCDRLGLKFSFEELSPSDLMNVEEAFLTSSTYCLVPVRAVNSQHCFSSTPGPVTRRLQEEWSQQIGLDFVSQCTSTDE